MSLPAVGKTARVVLRDDGTVALAADGKLVFVDPETGEARVADANADTLTFDAAYAVGFETPSASEPSTPVQIVDTESLEIVRSVEIDGTLLNFAEHTGDEPHPPA